MAGAQESKRDRILRIGAEIIHDRGYNHTGIKEILDKAGVPKGSFYHFFESKEDFGLQAIGYFSGFFGSVASQMLAQPGPGALEKMEDLFIFFENYFESHNYQGGCPIGNLAQETGSVNDLFAPRLEEVFRDMSSAIGLFLEEAAASGDIPPCRNTSFNADFILQSWEGTLVRMKVQRSVKCLKEWRHHICRDYLPLCGSQESS